MELNYEYDYINYKVKSVQFLSRGFSDINLPLIATGSWNEDQNVLSIWNYQEPNPMETSRKPFIERAAMKHQGDVSTLCSLSIQRQQYLFSGSSVGSIHWYEIQNSPSVSIHKKSSWKEVVNANITCIDGSAENQSLIAASENGKVIIFSLSTESITDTMDLDSNGISTVRYLNSNRIFVTAGSHPISQVKIWDMRHSTQYPSDEFITEGQRDINTCLEIHPTRPELLFVGTASGSFRIWDRRNTALPIVTENVHKQAIRDIKLNTESQQYLYTCADDGCILGWNFHHEKSADDQIDYTSVPFIQSIYQGALPWNTLDCDAHTNTIISGSDNDTLLIAGM